MDVTKTNLNLKDLCINFKDYDLIIANCLDIIKYLKHNMNTSEVISYNQLLENLKIKVE